MAEECVPRIEPFLNFYNYSQRSLNEILRELENQTPQNNGENRFDFVLYRLEQLLGLVLQAQQTWPSLVTDDLIASLSTALLAQPVLLASSGAGVLEKYGAPGLCCRDDEAEASCGKPVFARASMADKAPGSMRAASAVSSAMFKSFKRQCTCLRTL